MRGTRDLKGALALGLAAALALAGCLELEADADGAGAGGDVADAAGPGLDALPGDAGPGEWPPRLDDESDFGDVGPEGGELTLLGGEVVLAVPAGAFEAETRLEVTRTVLTVGGDDLVGYIWGDHGLPIPIDPRGALQVRVPLAWVPPGAVERGTLGLYRVTPAGDLEALPDAAVALASETVTLTAGVAELGVLAIAAP